MPTNHEMTTFQACQYLGYSNPAVIRMLIRSGKLQARKVGRDWFIRSAEVRRFEKVRAQ